MKIAMAVGIALLTVMNVYGDQLVVYVDGGILLDLATLRRAEYIATRMFARIGVSLEWRAGKLPAGRQWRRPPACRIPMHRSRLR